jgi:protein-L-isoaspartate(D-aspartate) O-methyltransferase
MNADYENLINILVRDGYLKTPSIIEAFRAIDRADFVLDVYKQDAYQNIPLPIGYNQTISQPLTVAFMVELLEPRPCDRILEIGAGSGWQTAILAYIVSRGGFLVNSGTMQDETLVGFSNLNNENSEIQSLSGLIIALERILELKKFAEKNIAKYSFLEKGIVEIIQADGFRGYRKKAPYDKIIAGAASHRKISHFWKTQLKIGGRIVAPLDQSIVVLDKVSKDEYLQKEYFGFSFVPLRTGTVDN